ncbi:hypothetical protein NEIG_00198 [Nematocida sp. ERTm5]|nr:hypothetical protein NEIG_00198 [Nematocida sp. ERTm5]
MLIILHKYYFMDGFNFAKQLAGKNNTEEENFLKHMKPIKKEISLKRAKRLGKYLYLTEDNLLVSLVITKNKPRTDIASGLVNVSGLNLYIFTNEA